MTHSLGISEQEIRDNLKDVNEASDIRGYPYEIAMATVILYLLAAALFYRNLILERRLKAHEGFDETPSILEPPISPNDTRPPIALELVTTLGSGTR